ncbi:hypothetical protein BH11MYX2_BH11MYX2_06590 [soil metagenome]
MGPVARTSLVALVALVPACDTVFGLDKPAQTTPCGVFSDPEPVAIDPRLVAPVRLTFTHPGDGGLGMINARLDDVGLRGDFAVKWDGTMWAYDETRSFGLAELQSSMDLRHTMATPDENAAFGSMRLGADAKHHLFLLTRTLQGTALKWVQDGGEIATSLGEDSYAGAELIDRDAGGTPSSRSVPIFRNSTDFSWAVAIAEHPPTADIWVDSISGGRAVTFRINEKQWPTGGSLIRLQQGPNQNGQVLFYSARAQGNQVGADLYYARRENGLFLTPVAISTLNSDQEDVEPWVDEACTTLTFRRADPEGSRSNDDGDSITGGTIYQATLIDDGM